MGRPRKYANEAEKQAAYRARTAGATAEIRLEPALLEWLTETAARLDVPRTELINSMLKLARTNRNWQRDGLTGRPLPRTTETAARQSWGMLKDTLE
jgi:hypothetical protein